MLSRHSRFDNRECRTSHELSLGFRSLPAAQPSAKGTSTSLPSLGLVRREVAPDDILETLRRCDAMRSPARTRTGRIQLHVCRGHLFEMYASEHFEDGTGPTKCFET